MQDHGETKSSLKKWSLGGPVYLATGYPAQAPAALLSKHTMIILLVACWIHLLCIFLFQPQDNRNWNTNHIFFPVWIINVTCLLLVVLSCFPSTLCEIVFFWGLTGRRFSLGWIIPFKPLSVILIHQLSFSNCKFIKEHVIADSPMSVTWRQELRSSSWRWQSIPENRDTSSSDKELQPLSTRTFSGMSWFVPCK